MTWKSPILSSNIRKLECLWIDDFLDGYDDLFERTVLLKSKGKVVVVCCLESLKLSPVMMCMCRNVVWGLRVNKIRRRNVVEKYFGKAVKEGDIIKEFSFTDCV